MDIGTPVLYFKGDNDKGDVVAAGIVTAVTPATDDDPSNFRANITYFPDGAAPAFAKDVPIQRHRVTGADGSKGAYFAKQTLV